MLIGLEALFIVKIALNSKELESDPARPHASGRTRRHFGNVEHPQNSFPALLPLRAMRLTMPALHSGQLVAATAFGVAICGLMLVGCAVAASDCFACLIMLKSFGPSIK